MAKQQRMCVVQETVSVRSVRGLFYDVGGEGVVAGDADGVTSQRVVMLLRRVAAG